MSVSSKDNNKVAIDTAAWMFNVVTSVTLIIINKALMATYGFTFATTLTAFHFVTTTIVTYFMRLFGYIESSPLPPSDLLKFVAFANISVVGMNVSLMWNSVGFYQIAKLSVIPVACFLDVKLDRVRYSKNTILSILLVLLGVGICTVTDVNVNTKGFIAAFIAIWSTAFQQYYVGSLQKKHSVGSTDLLAHTAPLQAMSLLVVGPVMDYWLTQKRVTSYNYTFSSVMCILLSCGFAIGTNLSQFICIRRFTAVSYQVIGHMKAILVLTLGFIFFGKDGLSVQVLVGMIIAVVGIIWYGHASSQPGGKERMDQYSAANKKSEQEDGFWTAIKFDEMV